jgi:hypothetical protein
VTRASVAAQNAANAESRKRAAARVADMQRKQAALEAKNKVAGK